MRPQHAPPALHLALEHIHLKVDLAVLAGVEVGLEAVEAGVDLAVLAEQLGAAAAELGHLLGQHGEEVRLLDVVVHGEVLGELQALVEELAERHVGGAAVGGAGCPEEIP